MNQIELSLKYPSLNIEFGYLFKIADLYKIDLSNANHIQWGGGRFGAMENDINLDIVGIIHNYINENWGFIKSHYGFKNFIKSSLFDIGYSNNEITIAFNEIPKITNYICKKCLVPINSNEYYHRARFCYNCEVKIEDLK